jgi:glutaconate CoA-transferase, subunit A
MTKSMEILAEGSGELLGWHDPDENRAWIRDHKPRGLIDKRMSVAQAVAQFVHDSDYIAFGGFGHVRVPQGGRPAPSETKRQPKC